MPAEPDRLPSAPPHSTSSARSIRATCSRATPTYTTQIGKLVLLGSFAYMSEGRVEVDGVESGRQGARYVSNLTASYPIDDRWAHRA